MLGGITVGDDSIGGRTGVATGRREKGGTPLGGTMVGSSIGGKMLGGTSLGGMSGVGDSMVGIGTDGTSIGCGAIGFGIGKLGVGSMNGFIAGVSAGCGTGTVKGSVGIGGSIVGMLGASIG
jgi:hypothetical protein